MRFATQTYGCGLVSQSPRPRHLTDRRSARRALQTHGRANPRSPAVERASLHKMILCEMAHTRCRVTRVIFDAGISGQAYPTGRTLDTGERHEDKLLWSRDRVPEASSEVRKPSSHQSRPKSYEGFERERPRSKWGVGSMKTRSTI